MPRFSIAFEHKIGNEKEKKTIAYINLTEYCAFYLNYIK